jgi:hypothetical protein
MAAAPVALVPGAIDAASAAAWLAAIDTHPAWKGGGADRGAGFNPHCSSLRLSAIPGLDAAAIAVTLLHGDAGILCRSRLGDALACDIDQCWVRRQYAPSRYPPGHAPHAWHQDGALGFDFLGMAIPASGDGLLALVTCWIALTPCGADSPGLELVARETPYLLPTAALREEAVRAAHHELEFERPVMEPGDCLVFGAGVLHHTHVSPAMRQDRTSLEIRLFDSNRIFARLQGDRFVAVHQALRRIQT